MKRRGIILAGGYGTRLFPLTQVVSKQLLPVYDKPMIYYPISTLMAAGIQDILLISTPHDIERFAQLLQDGSRFGINLSYATQLTPRGLADAFVIGESFLAQQEACLILGDNMFWGLKERQYYRQAMEQKDGATVFVMPVDDPDRYGVLNFDAAGNPSDIEEKPKAPKSNMAVTGLYFYDNTVCARAKSLKPSERGEIEITDINRSYLQDGQLTAVRLDSDFQWLDTGTHDTLLAAGNCVENTERTLGIKIGCPEETGWRNGWIDDETLTKVAEPLRNSGYGEYLLSLMKNKAKAA